jgi:hypothetical protein
MREVRVGVGYGWDGEVREDRRWKDLRSFLTRCGEEARGRVSAGLTPTVGSDEDAAENAETSPSVPGVKVFRLRASVGQFTWPSVEQHILGADVLVFDLTPTKKIEGTELCGVAPNVWLELGYALGREKPVFVVHREQTGYRDLPSDLRGLIVGHVPENGAASDTSLRMSVVQALVSALRIARG